MESERVRQAALELLDRRARSGDELARRLEARGFAAGTVAEVVAALEAAGLVDDERLAREIAEAFVRREHGASAPDLSRRLAARGVPGEVAARVAAETAGDPVEAAARIARKRLATAKLSPPVARRRIAAMLARRGFDEDVVRAALAAAGLEVEDPHEEERSCAQP